MWRFAKEIQKGDLVALPLKTQSAIAIGKIISDYEYKQITDNIFHVRYVEWIKNIPRSAFEQGILYSLGAFMTVCRIKKYDAENKVKKLLEMEDYRTIGETSEEETSKTLGIEEAARDQVVKYIGGKFKGHGLSRLVEAILKV